MLKKVIRWFQSPTFDGDEEKTRKAALLNVVINACLIVLPIIFAGVFFNAKTLRFETTLVIIACVWLTILGVRYILHSGQITTAGLAVVTILFASITLEVYNIGTLRTPPIAGYIVVIIIAGLSINRRAVPWMTFFSSLAVSLLWIAEKYGFLPTPNQIVTITQPILFITIFLIVATLFSLALKNIDKALAHAQEELNERMLAKEHEINRREMMERVIRVGKAVTEKTPDLRTAVFKIWDGVRNGLDFDRVATFLYDPETRMFQGSYGTDRSGNMSEEWELKFGIDEGSSFFRIVLSQPDSFFFTHDYETERGLLNRPGHIMRGVKYYAAVGVWAGDKPVAIICVDQLLSGRVISDEQLDALRFFAGYAGLAIENAYLSEREQHRQKMMEKVIQIGKEVAEQVTDFRTTLFKIWESIRNHIDLDRAAIFLYNANDSTMQGSYGTDRSGNLSEEWHMRFTPSEDGFLQRVISRPNGFYHAKDYELELRSGLSVDDAMKGVKHYAAVSCWSGNKPIAVICVDQLISGRVITEEQLEALRLFAGYAGLAIENTRLVEREQYRRKMMEKVIQIGKTVTEQTNDLHATLLHIRDSVRNEIDLDRAAVFIYDKGTDTLRGSYGTDRSGNLTEEWDMSFTPDDGIFLHKVVNLPNGVFHTENYELEFQFEIPSDDAMKGVAHYVAVACWNGDKPVAVICGDQLLTGRVITDEQLEALRLFAGYAGLAIDNARLNTELKGRMQEREQFIQELGNRNAELERFTYTVSHDLRSPIITIRGFIGMLDKDMREGQRERVKQDMQRISNATDKMAALLSDLLELSRIGRLVNPPEEIDLVQLAHDTLETVDGRLRAKNISTHISPNLPRVKGDRVRIGEVLENLLDNAAKYMGEQKDPRIEIGVKDKDGEQVIYVKDNGMGIDPQYLQRIFGLFEKLDPTSEGTGIGLALIKRIVEVHGGNIWAESEGKGKGSTFCFTIPSDRN